MLSRVFGVIGANVCFRWCVVGLVGVSGPVFVWSESFFWGGGSFRNFVVFLVGVVGGCGVCGGEPIRVNAAGIPSYGNCLD